MSDYKFFVGAASGPAVVHQNVELTPYGTDYRRWEMLFGVENTHYVPFIPFVPASWVRATLLFDGSFEDTAGGQINWGSRRTAGFLRTGFRFRLTPPGVIVVDVKGGIGGASNDLNFGKGIYPPHEYSFNIQGQASVGAIFCLNPDFCLGPVFGMSADQAFSTGRDYTSSHTFFGFRIEGQVNPSPVVTVRDPCEKEKKEYEKRIKIVIQEKEVWRTKYEDVVRKEGAKSDTPPPVPTPSVSKGPDAQRPVQDVPPAQTRPSPKPPQAKVPVAAGQDPKELEYRWLRELPKGIHFQNDKADLLPLPQQFPLCKGKCGDGNPVLNLVIFGARRWTESVVQLSQSGKPNYRMDIFVHGLANDTGDVALNFKLANQRRINVIEYLGGGRVKYDRRNYEGQLVPPLNAEMKIGSGKRAIRLGDVVAIKSVVTQPDPTDDIVMIMTGKRKTSLSEAEWNLIKYKVKGEEWRRANITYKIHKWDGEAYREITVDQYIQEQLSGMSQQGGK